jgi:drug/metabolite transporter (DMT)-like permease
MARRSANNLKNHIPAQPSYSRFFLVSIMLFQQFLGGLTFPVAKYGLQQIEPFTFAFYRFVISAVILLLINWYRKNQPRIEKKDYLKIIGLGFLIIFLNQATYLYGQKLTASGHGALLFATVPLWIFLGGWIRLKEKFLWRRAIGVGMGLIGVFFIITTGSIEISKEYLLGDLIILVAVLAWALYTVLGKPLVLKYGAFRTTAYALASGSALYFPFGLYRAITFEYTPVRVGAWISLIYVALGVSIAAYVLWYWLLKRMEASRLAVFHNIQPIVASAVAFIFLGEPVTRSFVLGGAIVLIGVLVTEW